MNNNQFNGNITFDITIGAKICNIPVNSVIKASVKKINKLGILAELGPLMIIVPKEIHQDKEPFSKINISDEIDLLVIGKTFHLNSNIISIYAKLNSEVRKKVVIQVRKGVDKHKNMDSLVAESESDIDDEVETDSQDETTSNLEDEEEEGSENLEELDDDLGELDEDMEGEVNPVEDAEIISDDDEEDDEEEEEEEDDGDYEDDE